MSLMQMATQGEGKGGQGGDGASGTGGEGQSGTPGAGESAEGASGAGGGEGQSGGEGEGEQRDFKTARPDNVPEKFWDADKGAVKTEDVLKSYGELEKALTKAKEKPKAPEKYEYKVPEEITKEFDIKEIPADDPYLAGFQNYAKEEGLSQEQHDKFVNWYLKFDLESARKNMIAEFGKLGSEKEATQRIKTLHQWASQKLTAEEQQVMSAMTQTAEGVKLFEKITKMVSGQRQLADADPSQIEKRLTQADIDDMMTDERYTNKRHPEFQSWNAKVTKAYERLYPDK